MAAALLLAGLTVVLVLARSSGSDDGGAGVAPSDCLQAWNSDRQAIASLSADAEAGECAVVFAANELDPEPVAAGEIHGDGGWVPLNGLLEPTDLAELQSAAVGGANATLTSGGELIPK